MRDETVKATLGTIAGMIEVADKVEAAGCHDGALRYRYEAAGLLSDLGHGLLAEADRVRAKGQAQHRIACGEVVQPWVASRKLRCRP